MSEECTHNCSTCSSNCSSKNKAQSLLLDQNECSNIKKVIAIHSGKGGVGKSLVTSLLAVSMQKLGYKCAILDADITGPSIPKAFGIDKDKIYQDGNGKMVPSITKTGIKVMSVNLMLDDPTKPILWRGSLLAGIVKQFWTDVAWDDVDFLFVDMPPGTGDIPLTIFQSLPISGIISVTTPQDLVKLIVGKSISMARMMNVPVLGLIENYSYFECPDNHVKYEIFGKSKINEVCQEFHLPLLGQLPIDPTTAELVDAGQIETWNKNYLDDISEILKRF